MQRWLRHHELKHPESPGRLGRGVAYADGRVFRGLVDGHVVAIDAKTDDVIWDVVGAEVSAGEFYTAAPVVWEGRVYPRERGKRLRRHWPHPGVRREDRQEAVELSQQAGLSWGYMSAVDREGRRIWVVAAERNAQRFIVHTDEKLTAVIVLEGAIRLR